MGLLLSVLVACVGVVELLTFFNNIRRNVRPAQQTDLATIRNAYLKDLYDLRDRVRTDLNDLLEQEAHNETKKSTMVRLTSHEDIELEYNDRIVSRSRTDSPRRFRLTETVNRSRSPTPSRRFLVNEEPQCLNTTNGDGGNLPEFLIEEKRNGENQTKRFVLKESTGDDASFPLPEQFVVTESNGKSIISKTKSRSGSPEYRESNRPPSPYPTFELTAPRNSICTELVDSTIVSVLEVDEDVNSKSPTPEAIHLESTTFNSTEYWTNKVLVVPSPKKSKSRSLTPKDKSPQNGATTTNFEQDHQFDECFLNELDGVTMVKRNNDSRKSIKRKKLKNEARKLDVASTSHDNNDKLVNIEHTLTEAANELRKLSVDNVDVKRDDGENKAFWVGRD